MNLTFLKHAREKTLISWTCGALCALCMVTGCDDSEETMDRAEPAVIIPSTLPPVLPPSTSRTPSTEPEEVAPQVRVMPADERDAADVDVARTEPSSTDSQTLDELVQSALATEEGRAMVAPLMREQNMRSAPSSAPQQPARQVVIRVERPSAQPEQPAGYYYGAGLAQDTAQPLFVDPTGQPVDGDGSAPSVSPFVQPTGYYNGSVPIPSSLSPNTGVQPLQNTQNVQNFQTIQNNQNVQRAPSTLVPQIPARSSLPSQVPANAGTLGSQPAAGPAISGPGVAGF